MKKSIITFNHAETVVKNTILVSGELIFIEKNIPSKKLQEECRDFFLKCTENETEINTTSLILACMKAVKEKTDMEKATYATAFGYLFAGTSDDQVKSIQKILTVGAMHSFSISETMEDFYKDAISREFSEPEVKNNKIEFADISLFILLGGIQYILDHDEIRDAVKFKLIESLRELNLLDE